jgi:hypoxanthine phosphoribosyltransferase
LLCVRPAQVAHEQTAHALHKTRDQGACCETKFFGGSQSVNYDRTTIAAKSFGTLGRSPDIAPPIATTVRSRRRAVRTPVHSADPIARRQRSRSQRLEAGADEDGVMGEPCVPLVPSADMPEASHTVLLTADEIAGRVAGVAAEIRRDYPEDTALHLVAVLTGGCIFLADLARALERPVTIDFVAVSSYGAGTRSTGHVRLRHDLRLPVEDRDVLIVEDIIDTGTTLAWLLEHLGRGRPRSLRTVALLDKPSGRTVDAPVDYVGFTMPNRFVVGYGLDHDEQLRHLPYIAALDRPAVTAGGEVEQQTGQPR